MRPEGKLAVESSVGSKVPETMAEWANAHGSVGSFCSRIEVVVAYIEMGQGVRLCMSCYSWPVLMHSSHLKIRAERPTGQVLVETPGAHACIWKDAPLIPN